ncbi:MAG: hypothetical protein D4R56_04670 [Deltaproteobacteria bacterium]|nr:MAG: hypothetical protein D4R56_04670 [Deltaproteobacteria bacterium]
MTNVKKPTKPAKTRRVKAPAKKKPPKTAQEATKPKHAGGRPPKYRTPEELQERIDSYFDSCWVDKVTETTTKDGTCTMSTVRYQDRPYTMMGLAIALGFNTRKSLCDYADKPEFVNTIKKARAIVEMNVEELLLEGKNAAGPIFWMKNNSDYRDRQELEHTGKDGGPIKTTGLTDEDLLVIASGSGARASKKA